ncbi:hypothetical protein D3C73_1243940 [compost metagenome]
MNPADGLLRDASQVIEVVQRKPVVTLVGRQAHRVFFPRLDHNEVRLDELVVDNLRVQDVQLDRLQEAELVVELNQVGRTVFLLLFFHRGVEVKPPLDAQLLLGNHQQGDFIIT